jgi:5-methylcytosine-specific restriction endonuclease McrA
LSYKEHTVNRIPYFIKYHWYSINYCGVAIYPGTAFSKTFGDMDLFVDGLPTYMVNFFCDHGRCYYCHSSIKRDLAKCDCGKPISEVEHIKIEYPSTLRLSHFLKLCERERRRVNSARRAKKIKSAGGNFNRKHIRGMHEAQRRLCYYCGARIKIGTQCLHVDHYEPLALGGRHDLANMVLACAKCNLLKKDMDGKRFDVKQGKHRKPQFTKILKAMRRDDLTTQEKKSNE